MLNLKKIEDRKKLWEGLYERTCPAKMMADGVKHLKGRCSLLQYSKDRDGYAVKCSFENCVPFHFLITNKANPATAKI